MRQLATATLATQNIYASAVAALTTTPSTTVATRCAVHVSLSGLSAAGGTFLLTVTVGGVPIEPSPMSVAFGATATGVIQREFLAPANAEVVVSVQSPNAADTSVGIVATLWDTTPLQPATVGRQVAIDANGKTDPTGLPTNFAGMVIEPATAWTDIVLSSGGSMMVITSTIGGFTEDMIGRYMYLECAEGFGVSLIAGFTSANVLYGYYPDAFFNLIEDQEEGGPISDVTGILGGRALLSENTHRPQDQSATSAYTLLAQRLLGTIAAGTHNAQSGNCYPVVSSGTYGNNALKTLIDAIGAKTTNLPASPAATGDAMTLTEGQSAALVAAIEAEIADDATGEAIKQAIIDKLIENLPDLDDLTLAAIGTACRDAVLNRVLAGNHNVAGSLGLLVQKLAVAGTLANTDNADSFKAAAPEVPTASAVATAVWTLANAIDGKTPQEAMRYMAAVLAGKAAGAGTATETFVGLDGSTPRVRMTADAEGNRTAVEYDPEPTP